DVGAAGGAVVVEVRVRVVVGDRRVLGRRGVVEVYAPAGRAGDGHGRGAGGVEEARVAAVDDRCDFAGVGIDESQPRFVRHCARNRAGRSASDTDLQDPRIDRRTTRVGVAIGKSERAGAGGYGNATIARDASGVGAIGTLAEGDRAIVSD